MKPKNTNPEELFRLEIKSSQEKRGETHKVFEAQSVTSEAIDIAESGGERVSEMKEQASENKGIGHVQHQTSGATRKVQVAAIKEKLLERMPSERVMKREIRGKLNTEVDVLLKKASRAERSGNLFELNRLIAHIRSIKDTLADLAHATYEMLKNLWLKVVHGIA